MRNELNLALIFVFGLTMVLGCGGTASQSPATSAPSTNANVAAPTSSPASAEKPTAIQAKTLTKAYDENELAADGVYKGKPLAVSGKVSNIAETMGNVTVQLEGHEIMKTVMCNFEEAEKANVAKLKKGQQATLIGTGNGMTLGIYVGLQNCKIQ